MNNEKRITMITEILTSLLSKGRKAKGMKQKGIMGTNNLLPQQYPPR
jgi:hypothetical protein